ncbi:MAG: ECF-type riboflavin transporter substrate-binding protein [Spirochaetaceae bacterium]|jgi:energy-coupling factor transport system substrate-specific component|nr:ECF-type riboflavin transporter substrate-binding protein [Spirochaetaceae bacterium]
MSQKMISIRTVVAAGIGAAVFFVLMRFIALPSGIPNTNINLSAAVLSLFAAVFGPVAGFFIGFIGHALTDLTWGGVWWSWVIADALAGLFIGFFKKVYRIEAGGFTIKRCIIFNFVQIVSNFIVWTGVAPTLDIVIYSEPANKVYLQGLVAAGMNSAVILILGTLLAFGYSRTRIKAGSLKAE